MPNVTAKISENSELMFPCNHLLPPLFPFTMVASAGLSTTIALHRLRQLVPSPFFKEMT